MQKIHYDGTYAGEGVYWGKDRSPAAGWVSGRHAPQARDESRRRPAVF